MNREWRYVLHQQADDFIANQRAMERQRLRAALVALTKHPFQRSDAEIRPPNDRIYSVRNVGRIRIIYWLDILVREVCIVRVEPW